MRRRAAVYSSSRHPRRSVVPAAAPMVAPTPPAPTPPVKPASQRKFRAAAVVALTLAAALIGSLLRATAPVAPAPEAAAARASAADAYERIRPSIVRVRGLPHAAAEGIEGAAEEHLGTGVVMVDTGIILTNLHVVQGAQ